MNRVRIVATHTGELMPKHKTPVSASGRVALDKAGSSACNAAKCIIGKQPKTHQGPGDDSVVNDHASKQQATAGLFRRQINIDLNRASRDRKYIEVTYCRQLLSKTDQDLIQHIMPRENVGCSAVQQQHVDNVVGEDDSEQKVDVDADRFRIQLTIDLRNASRNRKFVEAARCRWLLNKTDKDLIQCVIPHKGGESRVLNAEERLHYLLFVRSMPNFSEDSRSCNSADHNYGQDFVMRF